MGKQFYRRRRLFVHQCCHGADRMQFDSQQAESSLLAYKDRVGARLRVQETEQERKGL